MDTSQLTYAKPEPLARTKRRAQRTEAAIVRQVRAACVARDGYCRFAGLGDCEGPSQWAHVHGHQRARTRGQAPEVRHTTAGTLMACQKCHDALDGRRQPRMVLTFGPAGADGPFMAVCAGETRRVR